MMPSRQTEPQFRELSRDESAEVLTRNHVGRIAFSFHDSVDIRPIHYAYDGEWIFGRTSVSDKLVTLQHNQWVAFEVDEIEGPLDWVSVIARGSLYRTFPDGSEVEVSLHERAVSKLRKLNHRVFTKKDPTPFRTEVFGIHIDSLSGRSSSTEA
jgi:nitroimidazol reductase NimA-like FMN-containing flavoprotein (pyridoxamine 5'-phosphate oxidase superfamily)